MNTGALFVAVPADSDPINQLSTEDQAHVTCVWFGETDDLDDQLQNDLHAALIEVAGSMGPFAAEVAGTAQIGPDKASVLLLESTELVELREYMMEIPAVLSAHSQAKQFPWWIPHTTVGYDSDTPAEVPESIQIDRVGLWLAGEKTHLPLQRKQADLTAALSLPVINCAADVSLGVRYASRVPAAQWYVTKRATALGVEIPAQWSRT